MAKARRYVSYFEKLKDPRWQRKRLEILQRDNWTCCQCGATSKTLHVHHTHYRKGADPWDYGGEFLKSLCEDCHSEVTELTDHLSMRIGILPVDVLEVLIEILDDVDLDSHFQGISKLQAISAIRYGIVQKPEATR